MNRPISLGVLVATCVVGLVACSGAPNGGMAGGEATGSTSEALSGNDAVARAAQWVAVQVPYCQSPNGQPDGDPSCSPVCMRPPDPNWDPYRSDCSGFVSWAWNLPAPGRTTSEFAPAVTDITSEIDGNTLMPGDALNIPGSHMVLFVSWNVPGQNANFYEEPGCSSATPYAHSFTSNTTISGSSVALDYDGRTFTAIRYSGLTGTVDDGGMPPPPVDAGGTPCTVPGVGSGQCMLTTDCSTMGGTSTPGYCPGANNIECCTGIPAGMMDAGMPGTDSGSPQPDSGSPGMPQADSGGNPPQEDSGGLGNPNHDSGSGSLAPPGEDAGSSGNQGTPGMGSGTSTASGCSVASAHGSRSGSGGEIGLAALALVAIRRRKRR
jgi:hypothetical protein